MKTIRVASVCVVALASIHGQRTGAAQFISLSDLLPVSNQTSSIVDVSGDGSTVIGYYTSDDGTHAFQWRLGVGITNLEGPLGERLLGPLSVSSDGRKVLGSQCGSVVGCIWTEGVGIQYLDFLPGSPWKMSADGTTVIGHIPPDQHEPSRNAYVWNASSGLAIIPKIPGVDTGIVSASAISDDKSIVVGAQTYAGGGADNTFAYRWTRTGGSTSLGVMIEPGYQGSAADGTSADGSIIIGGPAASAVASGRHYRWTKLDGWKSLPGLPGGDSQAYGFNDVTSDGKYSVGWTDYPSSPLREPIIWDAANGTRNPRQLMETLSRASLDGWILMGAFAVSGDGTVIVGQGLNPSGHFEGWVMVFQPSEIPEPSSPLLLITAFGTTWCGRRKDSRQHANYKL